MTRRIFISYRQEDSEASAGRLYDELEKEFGRENVFMDVESLPLGSNYVSTIKSRLGKTDILLAVIGPNWLNATDKDGNVRLSAPNDFLSFEIGEALDRGIPVIPVLVQGAQLPDARALPEKLRPLARLGSFPVRHRNFKGDAKDLAEKLRDTPRSRSMKIPMWMVFGSIFAIMLGTVLVLVTYYPNSTSQVEKPSPSPIVENDPVIGPADSEKTASQAGQRWEGPIPLPREAPRVGAPAGKIEERTKSKTDQASAKKAQTETKSNEEQPLPDPALAVVPAGKKSFRDTLIDGRPCPTCPEMVIAPEGSFWMGSPESDPDQHSLLEGSEIPRQEVNIPKPLAVSRGAITRAEFEAFVRETQRSPSSGCYVREAHSWRMERSAAWRTPGFQQVDFEPVVCVSWEDATAYTAWLTKKTGKQYKLLSESEREYITRAGTTAPFWWGLAALTSTSRANFDPVGETPATGSGLEFYRGRTEHVLSFEPNAWGLYNVHGNVWEWTDDCWSADHTDAPTDGSPRTRSGDCSSRVVRGGSWASERRHIRAATRTAFTVATRRSDIGFRVARQVNR